MTKRVSLNEMYVKLNEILSLLLRIRVHVIIYVAKAKVHRGASRMKAG